MIVKSSSDVAKFVFTPGTRVCDLVAVSLMQPLRVPESANIVALAESGQFQLSLENMSCMLSIVGPAGPGALNATVTAHWRASAKAARC
jgi:hypothetical protein